MPTSTTLAAAVLLLHALRNTALPGRHRLLLVLLELPHRLQALGLDLPAFLHLLVNECELSAPEREALVAVTRRGLLPPSLGPDGVLDLAVALRRAVRPLADGATAQGEAVVDEGVPWAGELLPSVLAVDPSSSAGTLLTVVRLEIEAAGFEGAVESEEAAAAGVEELDAWACAGYPPVLPPVSPPLPGSRAAFEAGACAGDLPAATHALHDYFDLAYGTTVGGGSAVTGSTTPLVMLTGDGRTPASRVLGTTPLARVHELLASAASAPPAGGAMLGRSLLHYALLAHAALHASVGAWEEAGDALAECTRVAQASGDAPAAAYALLLAAEVKQGQAAAAAPGCGLDEEAADMYRRARHRAGELGLWRQQARASIALMEGAVTAAAASFPCGPSAASHPPIRVPDWLSVDPFASSLPGGYALGGLSPSSSLGSGHGPGAGGAGAGASMTLTSMPSGAAGREGLGAAALTAISSPTVATAVALQRRYRALAERRPSLGGGTATAFGATDAAATSVVSAPGAGAMWSVPLPLAWREVVALHGAGHASRARMWAALGRAEALHPITALLLADAARRAAAAAEVEPPPEDGGALLHLDGLLDASGCEAGVSAHY
jgi:hypothetical protein